ncbi:MAG: DNA alkylation repair protein [bacterium]|nr:DNA alkylation repair protein [bacterium]
MTFQELMSHLKEIGTEQNRKIYRRHGAGESLFGVSFKDLDRIKAELGSNLDLARKLWQSGNADARSLALKIGEELSFEEAQKWAQEVNYYVHAELLAKLAAKRDWSLKALKKWTQGGSDWLQATGYDLLAHLLKEEAKLKAKLPSFELDAEEVKGYLQMIEQQIGQSANRARHSMNRALIAMGTYRSELRDQVFEVLERIGPVQVDHGQTDCKTPSAKEYILKALQRGSKK